MKRRSILCLLVLLTIGLLQYYCSVTLPPRDKPEEICNEKIPMSICANKTQDKLEDSALEKEAKNMLFVKQRKLPLIMDW